MAISIDVFADKAAGCAGMMALKNEAVYEVSVNTASSPCFVFSSCTQHLFLCFTGVLWQTALSYSLDTCTCVEGFKRLL